MKQIKRLPLLALASILCGWAQASQIGLATKMDGFAAFPIKNETTQLADTGQRINTKHWTPPGENLEKYSQLLSITTTHVTIVPQLRDWVDRFEKDLKNSGCVPEAPERRSMPIVTATGTETRRKSQEFFVRWACRGGTLRGVGRFVVGDKTNLFQITHVVKVNAPNVPSIAEVEKRVMAFRLMDNGSPDQPKYK